jgi:pantoate--beta-alanine ligase
MKVITTVAEMKQLRKQVAEPVGLVPTMGYLHQGHIALVETARSENNTVVVSIFVNPTQFGAKEDFDRYPRDPDRDLAMLEKAGTDIVFMPPVSEMYPPGHDTWVDLGKITRRLEGASRPGHFRGVATVCNKLFNIIQPTKAYFGQKDAQQVLVIRKMVANLDMNLEIVPHPTVREPDGLAMSSRNTYLDPAQRKAAAVLHQTLSLAERLFTQGERDASKLKSRMTDLINEEPLARIDYVSIADTATLAELDTIEGKALVSMAVFIGKTRLIDNMVVE